jgi:predicted CXXCH cytochrome family protein
MVFIGFSEHPARESESMPRKSVVTMVGCSLLLLFVAGSRVILAAPVNHHGNAVDTNARYTTCLNCHDGVIANEASPCLASNCFFEGRHPVDRPFPPANKHEEFVTLMELVEAGIPLLQGRVDCISCHDLLKETKDHLRIEIDGSKLCYACHLK